MVTQLKVTLVNKYYPPHLGGIEYHLRDLAEALAARGLDIQALVANEGPFNLVERRNGVRVWRLGRAFAYASTPVAFGMPRALWRVSRGKPPLAGARLMSAERREGGLHMPPLPSQELRDRTGEEARAELLHLHFPYPWGELSWLLGGRRVPTVLTYHSDIIRQRGLLALYRPLLHRLLREVDLVIASSPDMVKHSPFLCRVSDKCRVVPFGIDVERYAASPRILERAAQIRAEHHRPLVLFVGRLIYYKGVDVLVRAMSKVDADLVLIGRGPLEAKLRREAANLGISGRLTLLPFQGETELVAWYHAADVFCLPSIARSEAFGLVQLEAHAAGTPVVSTRLETGVPFVNEHGLTGLTVPPGDAEALAEALNSILADEELRRRLGSQARERARRDFSRERMVERTLEVYEEALDLRGRPSES